ncbi:MAG: hypothetical protein ACYSQY_11990, partial [Planctomycetota bacterium]
MIKLLAMIPSNGFRRSVYSAVIVVTFLCFGDTSCAGITVEESSLVIPTYMVDPPNPMPRYYEGNTHQGVQRRIYPYPMNDGLT